LSLQLNNKINNLSKEDFLNRYLWVSTIRYFLSIIKYLIYSSKLTFFIFLKHNFILRLKKTFTNFGIPTFLISTENLKIQKRYSRKIIVHLRKLQRMQNYNRIGCKKNLTIFFTIDNIYIEKFILNNVIRINSIIITSIFLMSKGQVNSVDQNKNIYNLIELAPKNIIFFFYYPYYNKFITHTKLANLYKFANFVFIYTLFIVRKLIHPQKFNNLYFKNSNNKILFISKSNTYFATKYKKKKQLKGVSIKCRNLLIFNFFFLIPKYRFKRHKFTKKYFSSNLSKFLILNNTKKKRYHRKHLKYDKLLYSVKKYRLKNDHSEKKLYNVYKIHYKFRILIRKQLQKLYIYIFNLHHTQHKKAFDSRFLFKNGNLIKSFNLSLHTILVRLLFVPTLFDSITLIRSKYVTVDGHVVSNPHYILNIYNTNVIIPYLFQRLLYFYRHYKFITFGLLKKRMAWFNSVRYFKYKYKRYFIRIKRYKFIYAYRGRLNEEVYRIRKKNFLKRKYPYRIRLKIKKYKFKKKLIKRMYKNKFYTQRYRCKFKLKFLCWK